MFTGRLKGVIDISGQRFGSLIALEYLGQSKWKCKCDCGNIKSIHGHRLRAGITKSCGCSSQRARVEKLRKDLAGQRFGKLVAIEPVDSGTHHDWQGNCSYWKCRCDCGNETIVSQRSLTRGRTKSCKCLQKRGVSKRNTKSTREVVITRLMSSYKRGAKDRGLSFEIDRSDISNIIDEKCFYCGSSPSNVFNGYKNKDIHNPYLYTGIDRKNNDLGYTRENIVPCCKRCNIIKRDMEFEEFTEWITRVYKNLSQKGEMGWVK